MTSYLISILLLILSIFLLSSLKSLAYLPIKELQRRFRKNDRVAKKIYPAIKYKKKIEFFILVKVIVLATISPVLLIKNVSLSFSLISIISLFVLLAFILTTNGDKTSNFIIKLGCFFLPLYVRFFDWVNKKLSREISLEVVHNKHTGLFDLEDIEELVNRQLTQADNRMLEQDLLRIKKTLAIDNTTLDDIYVPKDCFSKLSLNDAITPVIIDEIHKNYQDGIPVYDDNSIVVGLISRRGLGLNATGFVRDYTELSSVQVDLKDNIASVIDKFYQNDLSSLLVYDNQEVIGTISSTNIFKWLFTNNDHKISE